METNVEMEVTTASSYGQARMRILLARSFAVLLSLAVINITVPAGAMTHFAPDPNAPKPSPVVEPKKVHAITRPLSAKEMRTTSGKSGKNPYMAGQNKWDVIYKGVNLMSGNYTTSGTDLTFEGGYGIPINVTRSYSANSPDEGPMGEGWTLSVDVRNTAGGLLKGPSSPVRSVPVSFKERPATQGDPRIPDANEPVEAVISTDAGGTEETIQKDADGILTTPAWDKNRNVSEYEHVTFSGSVYQILKKNTITTPEGTVYVYEKKGSYPSGTVPYDNPSATAAPANVLKITSATDRHGNVTNYTYSSGTVSFTKSNGTVNENPLTQIDMPNGHTITFTWGNGTNAPTNRIRTASDGVRTVTYGYTSGNLTSVTSPAGRVTTYGYGSSTTALHTIDPGSASNLLTSITDPRGLTTTIGYFVDQSEIAPYEVLKQAVKVYKITYPNGTATHIAYEGYTRPSDSWFEINGGIGIVNKAVYVDVYGTGASDVINTGNLTYWASTTAPEFTVSMSGNERVYGEFTNAASNWIRKYDINSQNLLVDTQMTGPGQYGDLTTTRRLTSTPFYAKAVRTTTTYNFLGNPLSKTVQEKNASTATQYVDDWPVTHTTTVGYAYWGKEKYYQQKAVKDPGGRYSYTDYFDSSATQGKKGMTYRVYDDKRTTFTTNALIPVPSGTPSGDYWKYQLIPSNSGTYSAEFDYDSKGRSIDVWKIQSTSTSPWTYVRTHTTYGADSSPTWGSATETVEDYGSGKINRTSQTLAYDSIGRATNSLDAAGHEFETTYDLDGLVQSIYRVDGSHNDPIVTYTYGTAGLLNGMVTKVVDGLSGVVQDFTYQSSSGGGKGQIASVTETNGSSSYVVSYTYNVAGDRGTSTYATPNGTTKWKYSDYVQTGPADSPSRVFQTLTKLDGSGNPTSEEFHYHLDSNGRLLEATFAMTPQSGQSSYSNSYPAATRARAYYVHDPAGRTTSVEHYWDIWGSSSYTSTPILGNACTYELSGLNRGLKTQSDFYVNNSGSWALDRSETFSYDADLDYLTSADYNDGLSNENPSWTYDAAGNRNDASVVDNLNRATTIGGVSRTYDILGNTLTIGSSKTMAWDVSNRMTSLAISGGSTYSYGYRADGIRVSKTDGTTDTTFCYDGQMPIETTETSSTTVVTKMGLGERGIDSIERIGSSTTVVYPIYDTHGNTVATLARSSGNFTIGDQRSYDAWGQIRQGATTGAPPGRYCANLGHVEDDESGLTYMRARFYDSGAGRFVSEDPSREGFNFFTYCDNDPVNKTDSTGRLPVWAISIIVATALAALVAFGRQAHTAMIVGLAGLAFLSAWFCGKYFGESSDPFALKGMCMWATTGYLFDEANGLLMEEGGKDEVKSGIGAKCVATFANYAIIISLFMILENIDD